MNKPLAIEIQYKDAFGVFCQFAHKKGALFLDSSNNTYEQGRYSFIAIDPSETFILNSRADFDRLQETMKSMACDKISGLPPFQGGVAGYLSYEMLHFFETVPENIQDEFALPSGVMGLYETVISFDHKQQTSWVISSDKEKAKALATQISKSHHADLNYTPLKPDWKADYSQSEYEEKVQQVIDYILQGDIFQANLTQKFKALLPDNFDPLAFYQNLRKCNPAPFSAYFNFGQTKLACSSPERFLKLEDKQVITFPIKGTRPRLDDPVKDQAIQDDLKNSEKDRAENTMIVDLLRNDLSRVCIPHSVSVPELCELKSFATVHHLISKVCGQLAGPFDAFDLIGATFPGGSITGAPKVRSTEIITEIEKTQRGPYCGSIGYVDFSGDMDINIVIRSLQFHENKACLQVGGGIVADSVPSNEYQEILDKADALFKSFEEVF